MAEQRTCIVTIHGIGFQQPPHDGQGGYADGLHECLQRHLGALLSGDPVSEFGRPAGTGAVYVHSDWPPDTRNTDKGLARLGTWKAGDTSHRQLDITGVPLAEPDHPISHVALVYSHLEDQGPHLGASLETIAKSVFSHGRYASLPSIIGMGVTDTWAVLTHRKGAAATPTPSLQVRHPSGDSSPTGPLSVIDQLDHDVSTYICRNDLRERIRSFAHDAILRICCRDDVDCVVINAHSQGTVLAYDVVRTLPPFAAAQVKLFVTAGSPLRKYATLFYWGTDAGSIADMPWRNFWDETDPVADPLAPPPAPAWRRGDTLPPQTGESSLFSTLDPSTSTPHPARLFDCETHNVDHGAGGGLPAHNYWDNDEQFVQPLVAGLQAIVAGNPPP